MIKKLFILCFLVSTGINSFSQSSFRGISHVPKMSYSLLNKLSDVQIMSNDKEIALFLRGDASKIKTLVEDLGGTYKYVAGNISVIRIPISKVEDLANADFVSWIEDRKLKVQFLNDRAVVNNHVQEV